MPGDFDDDHSLSLALERGAAAIHASWLAQIDCAAEVEATCVNMAGLVDEGGYEEWAAMLGRSNPPAAALLLRLERALNLQADAVRKLRAAMIRAGGRVKQ